VLLPYKRTSNGSNSKALKSFAAHRQLFEEKISRHEDFFSFFDSTTRYGIFAGYTLRKTEVVMKKAALRWVIAAAAGLLAACAFITVNVYFPEKDVKQAYKSLDEMLLKQEPTEQLQPQPDQAKPAEKPVSFIPAISFAAEAWAQDDLGNKLAEELAGNPEVQSAYDEMRARLPQLNALRDSGAVGEAADGSVVVRDPAKAGSAQAVVQAENNSRKTVIVNMAKAILRLNKQPETKDSLRQVLAKAAATYADTKREEAKSGWWIQLANGRWVQK
jgi:uncharacterized protein YdbL (DUF1318 family)